MTAQHESGCGTSPVVRALPLVLAALLAVAAVGTVDRAGCDDPGAYVATPDGIALVGSCLAPGDLEPVPGGGDLGDLADPAARRG